MEATLTGWCVAILTVIACVVVILERRKYARLPGKPGWPILGHTVEALNNIDSALDYILREVRRQKNGGLTFNIKMLTQPHMILTADPRNVQHILSTKFDNYVKGPAWHYRFKSLLGDGIFNVDGKLWYLHRKLSSRMFSTGNFRENMLHVFQQHGEKVLAKLRDAAASGAPFDLQVVIDV